MSNQYRSINLAALLSLSWLIQPAAVAFDEEFLNDPVQLKDIIVVADLKADEVWELKQSGKIMPLEDLIKQVRRDYPGRIIEIELDEEDGRYIYELELVDENGVVWDLDVDAKTGQVLKYEQDD
jgi:uncharacterized protein YpmB